LVLGPSSGGRELELWLYPYETGCQVRTELLEDFRFDTQFFPQKKHATLVFSPSESIPGPWMDPRNGVFEPAQLDRCLWNYQTSWGCRKDFDCERVRVHHKPTKELVVTGSLVWWGRG